MTDGGVGELPGFSSLVVIGRGGFGTVVRAVEDELGREVAVKVLTGARADDAASLERFRREARSMGAMGGHPNVVPIHSIGTTADGRPFLVMPYLARGSLHDRLASGPLPWTEAVAIAVQVAGALETAHRRGIVHRDVKPANVMVSDAGEPMLTDFGIARLAGGFETVSGQITASLACAAPEVLDGAPPTPAADVYALGATLHHLLAGEEPFAGGPDELLVARYVRIARDDPPSLEPAGVPTSVAAVVRAAMAKRPDDRPASALAFAEALRDAAREVGVEVAPPVVLDSSASPSPSSPASGTVTAGSGPAAAHLARRGRLLAVVALVALVVGVTVWLLTRSGGGTARPAETTTAVSTVDATPSAGPIVLDDAGTTVHAAVPAGSAGVVHVAAVAGTELLVTVTLAAVPSRAVAVQVLAGASPLLDAPLEDAQRTFDPVPLAADGTVAVQVGPLPAASDVAIHVALAPPDVTRTVAVGGTVDVALDRARQRGVVTVTGSPGQRFSVSWAAAGAAAQQYALLAVIATDGTELAQWTPLGAGSSKPITMPAGGSCTVTVAFDGDATGTGTLTVTG